MHNSNSLYYIRVKPNLIRLINQVLYDSELLSTILNYLNLIELSQFRSLNHNILFLVHEYFKQRVKIELDDVMKSREFSDFGDITYTEKTRAVVKVQDGCDRFCSYCIIPYARGRVRSRIEREFKSR